MSDLINELVVEVHLILNLRNPHTTKYAPTIMYVLPKISSFIKYQFTEIKFRCTLHFSKVDWN
jgi:hypothetical protein